MIVEQAVDWARMSRPHARIERIKVLSHGGYEIHYADGTSEAVVP